MIVREHQENVCWRTCDEELRIPLHQPVGGQGKTRIISWPIRLISDVPRKQRRMSSISFHLDPNLPSRAMSTPSEQRRNHLLMYLSQVLVGMAQVVVETKAKLVAPIKPIVKGVVRRWRIERRHAMDHVESSLRDLVQHIQTLICISRRRKKKKVRMSKR